MFKPIALIILMAGASGCDGSSSRNVGLSDGECWAEMKPGSEVSGVFLVYYFPKTRTFASKAGCHPASIGLILNEEQKGSLDELAVRQKNPDMMGLSAHYKISGEIFKNRNDPRLLLKVSIMELDQESGVQVLREFP